MNRKKIMLFCLSFLILGFLLLIGYFWFKPNYNLTTKLQSGLNPSNYDLKLNPNLKLATFAGGCFWCMEPPFEKLEGVRSVTSGYTGGTEENPTYEDVSDGRTGHYESVQIIYDETIIKYEDLLQVYWRQIDPTDANGQFVDRGNQYRSAIFYHDEQQKLLAEQSLKQLQESRRFDKPIVTEILPYTPFYTAEEYHQDYYLKNPIRYKYYRNGSGRDDYLKKIWGNDSEYHVVSRIKSYEVKDKEAKLKTLTDIQYTVTQNQDTERPFTNEYFDNKKEGIYVDIVSGEPLFSSTDKFDSGTGWPSFKKPLEPAYIVYKEDRGLGVVRVEVRSKYGDSHLGHVFEDGPPPTGLRYCMNSASLLFISKDDLKEKGYENYLYLFK